MWIGGIQHKDIEAGKQEYQKNLFYIHHCLGYILLTDMFFAEILRAINGFYIKV
jgi:hypothetical protein